MEAREYLINENENRQVKPKRRSKAAFRNYDAFNGCTLQIRL